MIERDEVSPELSALPESLQPAEWITELFTAYTAWCAEPSKAEFDNFLRLAYNPIRCSMLRFLASRSLPDRDLVDDLVQETYVKLCAEGGAPLGRLRSLSALGLVAYLRVVAHNVASDYFRSRVAGKRGGGRKQISLDDAPPSAIISGQEKEDNFLLMDRIDRCLHEKGANVRDRAIFWLYFRQGFSARAIAAITAVRLSQKGVESLIFRLIKAIQDCVKGKSALRTSQLLES